MHLIVRYGGIVVHSQQLAPGEYTIGRGRDNKIRLHLSMLSRRHGKIYCEGDTWYYQDLRPSSKDGRVPLDEAATVALGNNLELLRGEGVDLEKTKQDHLSDIRAAMRAVQGGFSPAAKIAAAAAALTLAASGGGGYAYWKSRQPMDANGLLAFAKTKIVELELPRKTKGQDDLRKYAGLKDEDFTDTLGFCTGFIIAPDVVLTANHCLQGTMPFGAEERFTLKTHDGKQHAPKAVLGFDVKRDFAFIEVPGLSGYGHLDIRDAVAVGEKVYTIGNVAGEGLAIRDGIMASKTPDKDDPSVEFLRYSAAASPGNSGGPLLDGYGKVVALVFARSSLSENYNLGTTGKDLLAGRRRFVDDRGDKTVALRTKDIMQFRPEALLYALRIPFEPAWRESPESIRPLEDVEATVKVPAPLEAFTKEVVEQLAAATAAAYDTVAKDVANATSPTSQWASYVSGKTRIIIPGQLDESSATLQLAGDGKQLRPEVALLSPPCSCLMRLGSDGEGDGEAKPFEADGLVVRPVQTSTKDGGAAQPSPSELVFSSDDGDGKRPLSMFAYRPVVHARTRLAADAAGGWEAARAFDPKTLQKALSGKEGLLASSNSPYVRPKAQREFSLKELDEELSTGHITDGFGRTWTTYTASLFDSYTLESYCLPLPQGGMCLTSLAPSASAPLEAKARENYAKYTLTPYLVQPTFWTVDALMDYEKTKHAATDPMMRDFHLEKTADGRLKVSMRTLGVEVLHGPGEQPTMLRLGGGLVRADDGQQRWIAVSHQAYFAGDETGKDRRICEVGVEVQGSNSVSVLHGARRKEAFMRAMKSGGERVRLADVELPKDRFHVEPLQATVGGTPTTLYSYCAPLTTTDPDKKVWDVAFYDARPFEVQTQVVAH